MNILMASSEVVPFAKTGGLADVCGALPVELAKLGQTVYVFLPAFRGVGQCGQEIHDTGIRFQIPIGNRVVEGRLLQSTLPNSDVTIYFIVSSRRCCL